MCVITRRHYSFCMLCQCIHYRVRILNRGIRDGKRHLLSSYFPEKQREARESLAVRQKLRWSQKALNDFTNKSSDWMG